MKKSVLIIIAMILIGIGTIIGIKYIFMDKDKNINLDVKKLEEELISSQIFEDDLNSIDRESIIKKYDFDSQKIKNINSCVGTGATAEEILIIELFDKNDIEEIEKIIETKIEERKENFQNYLPEEVFKLENYYLESKGNHIILCISNDYDKAEEIIVKNINS